MSSTKLQITKGQALVLAGPQGCGKTIAAQKVAKQAGTYINIEAYQLANERSFDEVLAFEADTVIVDGIPAARCLPKIKTLLTANSVFVAGPHEIAREVRPPNFIFCTCEENPLPGLKGDRRWNVVHLKG